ncbi:hypothetical protein OCU04_004378 [Sclerotinia nivalis]|uniref:Uncharacterized protein n=1 Tax=Sclerotinia nivalis TaxID=352851 RepID=A0A9X0AR55_9HELO|nr:hypothetical protein OCU04_004378 [Sclerotinia nivalis]
MCRKKFQVQKDICFHSPKMTLPMAKIQSPIQNLCFHYNSDITASHKEFNKSLTTQTNIQPCQPTLYSPSYYPFSYPSPSGTAAIPPTSAICTFALTIFPLAPSIPSLQPSNPGSHGCGLSSS